MEQIIAPDVLEALFSPKQISSMHADFLRRALPRDAHGDWLYATILFANKLRRMPSERMLFNDQIYRIRTTSEILDPLRVFVTDKEFMKIYVKAMLGEAFTVPTLRVLHSREELRSFEFPEACCIKPTHLSGHVVLRRDAMPLDLGEIEQWLDMNHYDLTREVNYKNLKPKIIVEPIIFGDTNIMDYKIFCFRGEPKLIQLDLDRRGEHTRKIFDTTWRDQGYSTRYPRSDAAVAPPANLERMLHVARVLSAGFSFVSVDLYSDGEACLVGEITNCPGGGLMRFIPPEAEETASSLIFG
jgi:hypothetical protein